MKRKWRMFVALSCIVALLVTGPGLSVSASESQDAEIAAEAIVEEAVGSVSDVMQEQTIEETETSDAEQEDTIVDEQYPQDTSTVTEADIQEETDDIAETPAQEIVIETSEEEEAGESQIGQSDGANQEDNVTDLTDAASDVENTEENVGLSYYPLEDFPVGDNVTATLYWSAYTGWPVTYTVTLDVYDGTINYNWREMIGEEISNSEWMKEITYLDIDVHSGKLHLPEGSWNIFSDFSQIKEIDLSKIDASKVYCLDAMFKGCKNLESIDMSSFYTPSLSLMTNTFEDCTKLKKINLTTLKSKCLWRVEGMFANCTSLEEVNLSGLDFDGVFTQYDNVGMFENCPSLKLLYTPVGIGENHVALPKTMYDEKGEAYTYIPTVSKSITLRNPAKLNIKYATLYGITRSYGYTGSPHTPNFYVGMNGKTLTAGTDYTYEFTKNIYPGVGKLTVTGKGNYFGTLTYNFTIVDCVDVPQDGHTYCLVPKNNPQAKITAAGGNMVNNTKVTITSPNTSEAQRFVVKKYPDGKYKIYNAKSITAVAVQQNSTIEGKGVVIYQDTTREAQKWKLERKADNSYAIVNAVTGYSISSPDQDATIGSQLIVKKTAASSLQRFYFVEAEPVLDEFGGRYTIACRKDSNYVVDIAGGSTAAGANAQLYKSNGTDAQKFDIVYSGSGYYRLVNKKSGLVLTVKDDSAVSGANVEQRAWQGLNGQRWWLKYNEEDGTVTMRNRLGTYLHLTSNKVQNGTNICAKTEAATTAQRWKLKPY